MNRRDFGRKCVRSAGTLAVDAIEQAAFARTGRPLLAYWFPADVQKDMPDWPVEITFTVQAGLAFRDPVLVDPLSGEVFRLDGKQVDQQWQFAALPLKDYPMLVTDRSVALDP